MIIRSDSSENLATDYLQNLKLHQPSVVVNTITMRIKEILTEMPAIAWRSSVGKPYVNPQGELGTALYNYVKPGKEDNRTTVYAFPDPDDNPQGQYSSVDQLDRVVNRVNKFVGGNLKIMNTQQRNQNPDKFLGFAVSYWVNENGQRYAIGKYVHNTKTVKTGHKNQTVNYLNPARFDAHDLGPELGYMSTQKNTSFDASKYGDADSVSVKKSSRAELRALKPADLLEIGKEYTPQDVLTALSVKLGQTHPLVNLTQQVLSGAKSPAVDTTGIKVENINKDFTEILHPLALFSGAYIGASPKFNTKTSKIVYTTPAGSLSDSIIKSKTGAELFVSSKYEGGTPPAMGKGFKKLLDASSSELKNKYKSTYKILNSIADSSWEPSPGNLGPLKAAVSLRIVSKEEADYIANTLSLTPSAQFSKLPADCPERLRSIVQNSKSYRYGKQSYYILMLHIMKTVAQKLNNDPATSDFIRQILSTNFVTMNTSASVSGEINTLSFSTKLLDKSGENKVVVTTGTAYHSDHIKNALQFTIK